MTRKTRLAIIGAGSAGLTALKEAQRITDDIILVNDGPYGTTCARVGCMPSKAMIAPARAFQHRDFLAKAGISGADGLSADIPAVLRHVRGLRDRFIAGPVALADSLGARSISGRARFLDPNTLVVNDTRIEADAIIIATGSHPVLPAPWAQLGSRVQTSDTIFEQPDLGRRVAVVGLGAIGAELGQALALLGLDVTGLTQAETLAGLSDPVISASLAKAMGRHMDIMTEVKVSLEPDGPDAVTVTAGERRFTVDWVLASLGRRPNIADLGLENLGVAIDDHGMPEFDRKTLRIGETTVYIAGDVSGLRPLLHEAADEGRIAAWHALHPGADCLSRRTPLGVVFTEPSAATIGAGYASLKGRDFVTGQVDFSGQGRALMEGRNAGRLHVYVEAPGGRLLGAELAAPDGEHLAHLLAWSIQQGLNVDEVLHMPFYHPVVEEGLRSALQDARRKLGERRTTPDLPLCEEPASWAHGGD